MNVIYSDKKVEELEGVYASPSRFNGDTEACKCVFTDNEDIKKAYEAKGIEVKPIKAPKKTTKTSSKAK